MKEQDKLLKLSRIPANTNAELNAIRNSINTKSDKTYVDSELSKKETPSGAQTKATQALNDAKAYAEPKFSKNNAFNKNFGTAAGTVAEGNHSHAPQTSVSGNAGTATKLQTARTINGVSFDGTGNITVKAVAQGGAADTANKFLAADTRSTNENPQWYMTNKGKSVVYEFKNCETIGLKARFNEVPMYGELSTYTSWSDSSGGFPVQVLMCNTGVYYRTATSATAWAAWQKFVNRDELNTKVAPIGAIVANRIATFNDATGRVIKDSGFTIATSVPSGAKFTDTWRGIQNSLTSDATDQSLSAAQGKALKTLVDGKANASHGTHVVYETNTGNIKPAGTVSVGTSGNISRADHVHPTQTTVSGNAGTATKLQAPRAINGVNFDGSANITVADNTKLSLGGGTVTGVTNFKQGTLVHAAEGTSGTVGYVAIADIVITSNYQNQPISITTTQRGRNTQSTIYLTFTSANSLDPTLASFKKVGDVEAYIHKTSASNWKLYIKKTEGHDKIDVVDVNKGTYMSGTRINWINTNVASLPSGHITATDQDRYNGTVAKATWVADGGLYSVTINHNLNSTYINVSVVDTASNSSVFVAHNTVNSNSVKIYSITPYDVRVVVNR